MKAVVNKMIKETLMDGLRRSHYDLDKTQLSYPRGGLFTSRQDIDRAFDNALMMLQTWQGQKQAGKLNLPPTLQEFERYLDIRLANQSFTEAAAMVNHQFSGRSNSELVKEMREAIEELRGLGCSDEVYFYERIMKQRIGEE